MKSLSLAALVVLAAVAFADDIYTPGAKGQAIVDAALTKLHGAAIFPDDKQFLRRIAYVESKFGTDPNTYRAGYHGGIFQVDKIGFDDTQYNRAGHQRSAALKKKHEAIKSKFGIDWLAIQWIDLRKPFYSAIAARLFIANKPAAIPGTVEGQAHFWKTYYNTAGGKGSEQKFIDDVHQLEG